MRTPSDSETDADVENVAAWVELITHLLHLAPDEDSVAILTPGAGERNRRS
jgi:hypothetical protein